MKKIIILLITATLLTGCSATYEITINENEILDSIKIFTDSQIVESANKEKMDEFSIKLGDFERGYDYYKRELYSNDGKTGYNYTYNFNYTEYDAMSQIRKCYLDFELKNEDVISIKTSDEFLCSTYYPEMNNIKISITSEYKILNSNADSKVNNTHTWIIDKKNYKKKPIEIRIDKSLKAEEKKNINIDLKMILTFIIFFLLIAILIINKRKEKKQR